ncbi:MAG: hypothetical protein M1832_005970 [Thelocarpon impressellum]|nr:MAG: hypothetical protein M1832_005970 [Thelocarpon impressellum]
MAGSEPDKEQRSEAWLAQEREMIAAFFEEKDCESFARSVLRADDIHPVENQGATSYTLICPSQSKIIQFRLQRLDEELLALARQIYGTVVPSVTFHSGLPIPVYVSPVIPGQIHIFQKFPPDAFPLERQLTTTTELARFVAKSAARPLPASSYSPTSWTKTAPTVLEKITLNQALEMHDPRFKVKALHLLDKIHLLDKLPPVLSHADFAEVNILVNAHGNVTGVIDFEDAQTEAFGMCIFGVYEGFFGEMRHQKWSFFDMPAGGRSGKSVRQVLEAAFWDTLWDALPPEMRRQDLEEAVMVAVDIGIVNRYFVRGLLEGVDLGSNDHRMSLEFARGLLLDR